MASLNQSWTRSGAVVSVARRAGLDRTREAWGQAGVARRTSPSAATASRRRRASVTAPRTARPAAPRAAPSHHPRLAGSDVDREGEGAGTRWPGDGYGHPPGPRCAEREARAVAHPERVGVAAGVRLHRQAGAGEGFGADTNHGVRDGHARLPHHGDIDAPGPRRGRRGLGPDGQGVGARRGAVQLHHPAVPGPRPHRRTGGGARQPIPAATRRPMTRARRPLACSGARSGPRGSAVMGLRVLQTQPGRSRDSESTLPGGICHAWQYLTRHGSSSMGESGSRDAPRDPKPSGFPLTDRPAVYTSASFVVHCGSVERQSSEGNAA